MTPSSEMNSVTTSLPIVSLPSSLSGVQTGNAAETHRPRAFGLRRRAGRVPLAVPGKQLADERHAVLGLRDAEPRAAFGCKPAQVRDRLVDVSLPGRTLGLTLPDPLPL